jgi:hypothetical protein
MNIHETKYSDTNTKKGAIRLLQMHIHYTAHVQVQTELSFHVRFEPRYRHGRCNSFHKHRTILCLRFSDVVVAKVESVAFADLLVFPKD